MKIGIFHLTDMHFLENTKMPNKIISISKVIVNEFRDIKIAFLVISGDIANTGKEVEYASAKSFINLTISFIKKSNKDISIKVILVPGNHDCNFSLEKDIRKILLGNVEYKTIGTDNSILEHALMIQEDFWKFYSDYNQIPEDKVYYKVSDTIENKKISFHCFNTAWMSQLKEKPGSLFMPIAKFKNIKSNNDDYLNIAVFHHPLNWFNPNTEPNNKNEFQAFLEKTTSFQLIGHEHETQFEKRENIDNNTKSLNFSGSIFNNNRDPNISGFQLITINLDEKSGNLKRFNWKEDIFLENSSNNFSFNGVDNRQFQIKRTFDELLKEVKAPLSKNNKKITLSELYIYPDLNFIDLDVTGFDDYIDSEIIIGSGKYKHIFIEGDNQSGKTSLLKMFFRTSYHNGLYPLFLNGEQINKHDVNKIMKDSFSQIYNGHDENFEGYKQIDKENKVLLIDNLQVSKLNSRALKNVIDDFSDIFDQIIITVDKATSLMPQLQADFENFYSCTLSPLGYKKINDLIRKYHLLDINPLLVNEAVLLQKTKNSFDQVRQVLGNNIIPAYPIFIISILHSLDYKPLNLNETSHGYCYQTLIHFALAKQARLPNNEIDTYINYIKEFAFYLFESKFDEIDENEFKSFHTKYEASYIISGLEKVKSKLILSQILKEQDGYYSFGYKYIFYFLIAKYIAEKINTQEGERIIRRLFQDLHIEKNANILVFITHHTKDLTFIEESLFSTLTPFENTNPITLEKRGEYYKLIQDIVKEISTDIIELNRKPEKEREEHLANLDQVNRIIEKKDIVEDDEHEMPKEFSEELNKLSMPFYNSFRSLEIVGQIIRNRKGSLSKQKLSELITELYNLGFRTIGFIGEVVKDVKNELTLNLMERIKEEDNKQDIESKINSFFQFISLHACLGIISRLVYSAGVKELKDIYKEVSKNMGTPASKLVTFSINSYYNDVSANDIKIIANELKDNQVALQILKIKVKSFLYNNHVDFRKKQKIAEVLNMQIDPQLHQRRGSK